MRRYSKCSIRVLFVFAGLTAGPALAAEPVTLNVSPTGPIKTVTAARDTIRAQRIKGEWVGVPITVLIHEGDYLLDEPLEFGPDDGGSPGAPVTYAAFRDDQPIVSGGRLITKWRETDINGKKLWAAELPDVKSGEWYFRQLFVETHRRPRTRLPKEGFTTFTGLPEMKPDTPWHKGQTQANFKPGDLKADWRNLTDVEVIVLHRWIESRLAIKAIGSAANLATFAGPSTFRLTDAHGRDAFARYYVENVFEALDEPGEWYLDRVQGLLYYLPMPGESMEEVSVIAPRWPQLIRVTGTAEKPVTDLHFEGLTLLHTSWYWPPGEAGSVQAAFEVPGAIHLANAKRCEIRDCTIAQLANYGIELVGTCEDTKIVNNVITDLGAGGVKIGHGTTRTVVHNNDISDGGKIFHSAVGVWIGNSSDNHVTHNDIHHLYYTGVSVGWRWGYGLGSAARNIIAWNHIHHIGRGWLSDMGGIYTLGISPGTKLRHNRIHDIEAFEYGGWGLYNDEGSTHILLENNVVYRTTHGGYHQHYGRENIVRNNVLAFAKYAQVVRTRQEAHISFIFENNIVYFDQGKLLGSNWTNEKFVMDNNVYWRPDGEKIDFATATFDEWKARGHDTHSVIADPKFKNVDEDDYSLQPDSPAFDLGFVSIDISRAGRIP